MKNDCIYESNGVAWNKYYIGIPGDVPEADVRSLAIEISPAILKRASGGWALSSWLVLDNHYSHRFNKDQNEWLCEIPIYRFAEKKEERP